MRIDLKDVLDLDEDSRAVLEEYRRKRAFTPAAYVEAKTAALGDYCKSNGIDSLTVLISGGIDSAVVAGIAKKVSNRYGTGVHMVTIPATSSQGVTRQDETVVLAQELADSLDEVLDVLPFDGVVDEAVNLCDLEASRWGAGQAVS